MPASTLPTDFEKKINDFFFLAKIDEKITQSLIHDICKQLFLLSDKEKGQNAIDSIFQTGLIITNEINLDSTSVICFALYTVLKENAITREDSKQMFDTEKIQLVLSLQKIDSLDTSKYCNQTDNFIKLLLTISDDLRVILIKLSERIFQMRNISMYDEVYQKKIATEVSALYAPIAHRIGLYKIKTEFDDLCMQFFSPKNYFAVKEKLTNIEKDLSDYINEFIAPLNKKLLEYKVKSNVFGRVKSIPSIWKKMQTQAVEFEKVYDLFAIRIIVESDIENEKSDCWKVYSLVTEEYTPNPKRLRDWITIPKSSGYESLHTTVIGPEGKWVEVQIRTHRMNEVAEKGFASHWKYKYTNLPAGKTMKKNNQTEIFSLIREALEKPSGIKASPSKEKKQLYSDEIFVFTPKGDLKKLHIGYTVLDFAYEIHSDVGGACTGAVVNNKMVPLKQVLNNGDTVKIITTKNQKPNHSWLDFVKSAKAISRIKHALKAEEYKDAEEGKAIIKHKIENLGLSFDDQNLLKLAEFYKCENTLEMYQLMGEGKLDATKIKKILSIEKEEPAKFNETDSSNYFAIAPKTTNARGDYLIIDNQAISYGYIYAQCCSPIPGDKIFGFVTVSKGIKIHKTNCPNAKELIVKFPYRVVETQWKNMNDAASFTANLRITGHSTLGIASKITKLISDEMKLNMSSIRIDELPGGMFEGSIGIYVNSRDNLDKVIFRIRKIKEIVSVQRLDM